MSEEKESQISKALGALGTLDRATEFQTFLLLASFAIALNITLTLTHQTNLAGISWQYAKSNLPIGQVLIFLTGFALFMSCLVGILRYVVDQVVLYPVITITSFLRMHSTDRYRRERPKNWVRPHELLNAARTDEDDAYLEQYNSHMNKKRERDAAAWRTASLCFGLLVLLLIEATLPATSSLSASFVRFLDSVYVHLGDFVAMLVVAVLVFSWLYRFIEDDFDNDWVICPRLYAKLEAERRQKEEELRATTHRMHM